ncbi:hypothetical protein M9H77_28784 [Catharanthus roseus]|uniref:Uncharacterized protein n=1 Tax=Catharanthus roseus TaxID=4058 RepID=A0ACC0AHB6_CATRO|nr:hypothetical protein M9H77_28784 [Catharanthus roseus]
MGVPAISIPSNITTITATSGSSPRSFDSTLKSLSKSGKLDEALQLIIDSKNRNQFKLDSCNSFLHACISAKSLRHGLKFYNHLPNNLLKDPFLKSKFITLFSVCGKIDEARRIFEQGFGIEDLPESVWVAMGIGYLRNGHFNEALLIYVEMIFHGVYPGNFAFSVALKACSELLESRIGKAVHAQIIKAESEPDQVVYNALMRLYTECGFFEDELQVFEEMPERNVVSWNSKIAGLIKKDRVFEAFETFRRMQRDGVSFSWVSFTSILPICAQVTSVYSGKEIHAQIFKSNKTPDVLVLNAVMDMYAKCGEIKYCRRVFDGMNYKDLTSWNTMLNGYAVNGKIEEALVLFDEMVGFGIQPDGVTFVILLSGCSHTGLVLQGQTLFERMITEFGIAPNLDQYACLVDLLGRAGKIEEAVQVVKTMPVKPSGSIWGSLLNACRLHGYVPLAEVIAKELFLLEPENSGNYVMLSNTYAKAGMWKEVNMVREMMEKKGIKKETGCSWIQIRNRVHTFVAGGGFEFRNSDEYKKVESRLMRALEKSGYEPDTGVVLHDVGEEVKVDWVCGHSERLATIYGLIHCGSGMPLRITKNLRVCADCHAWMKFVSKVTRRKIILRDTNRFHHFDNGSCSCKDYW